MMTAPLSWTRVWEALRPSLRKLARQPLVWIGGGGLVLLGLGELWLRARAAVPVSPLLAETVSPDPFGEAGLAVSVLVKLALVIALIYGCFYLLRRWQGGWFNARPRQVALLETTRLAPRQALHLVRVGERVLLLGATDQTVTFISELAPAPPAAFATTLEQALHSGAAAEKTTV